MGTPSYLKGYLLLEVMVTFFILSVMILSSFRMTTSYISSLLNRLTGLALFSQLQCGQTMAMSIDSDVVFQLKNNTLLRTMPNPVVCLKPFSNQTLTLTNKSGIGFTQDGHTKYAGTLKINGLDTPQVSLGVGYGKVTLK